MTTSVILGAVYAILILAVCVKIITESNSPSKTYAYILLIVAFPIIGMAIYFSFGLNYRKKKIYEKKINIDHKTFPELEKVLLGYRANIFANQKENLAYFDTLAHFLQQSHSLTGGNSVELLINGENKFPKLIEALKSAKHHIHLEYYILDADEIGNEIAGVLATKVKEGVEVRLIYDDYGCRGLSKKAISKLKESGVETYPFLKINSIQLGNRINYRNHRKIVVIDGTTGFLGGINITDEYINRPQNRLFWRDTHLKFIGPVALNLQFIFLTDWNFCSRQNIGFSEEYFPLKNLTRTFGNNAVQIISSGPDSDHPNILYSLIQLVLQAKKELYITTPYFIPEESFLDAIKIAALSGVKVKLLVPKKGDSAVVNITSQSHYQALLECGVEIYLYKKGFVHAKTIVCDRLVSVVGTANLDIRSFDLNFETNAIVYSKELADEMVNVFNNDIENTEQILPSEWNKRKFTVKLAEKILYLFSPLM
ncbi:MAG: cardiolipin synthase [Paludibacteraceae bacterium]